MIDWERERREGNNAMRGIVIGLALGLVFDIVAVVIWVVVT